MEEGRAKLTFGLSDKVGLPDFSNVTIGPVVVERYCDDTPEARAATFAEMVQEVEDLMGVERAKVLAYRAEQERAALGG